MFLQRTTQLLQLLAKLDKKKQDEYLELENALHLQKPMRTSESLLIGEDVNFNVEATLGHKPSLFSLLGTGPMQKLTEEMNSGHPSADFQNHENDEDHSSPLNLSGM